MRRSRGVVVALAIVLAALMLVSFGCSKKAKGIAGIWNGVYDWGCDGSSWGMVITINEDGSFVMAEADDLSDFSTGVWTLDGDTLTLPLPGGGPVYRGTVNGDRDAVAGPIFVGGVVEGCWNATLVDRF